MCPKNQGRWKTSYWCAWQDHWECWVCRAIQDKLILWGVFTTGSFWTGQWTLPCFQSTLGVPSTGIMHHAEKLVVEAFEPLKKTRHGFEGGIGVADNHKEEEDEDHQARAEFMWICAVKLAPRFFDPARPFGSFEYGRGPEEAVDPSTTTHLGAVTALSGP
ncbi:hypothetical protein THAOC_22177, partial [Thalassiosira oceanica]